MRHRTARPSPNVPFVLGCVCLGLLLIFGVTRIIIGIQYDREVSGHLKRAADANQIALAITEVEDALKGMDERGLDCGKAKECYTSVLYTTPDEDIGFWRTNIKQTLGDLEAVPADANHLVVSNTLMKVRETLLDSGEAGDHVTDPDGVSLYPSNKPFFWFGWLTFPGCCWFFGLGFWRIR